MLISEDAAAAYLLPLIMTLDSEMVQELLYAAGIRNGTWVHLQDAHMHCDGDKKRLAAALYIQVCCLGFAGL